jgi:hypothetical protein
VWVVVGVLGVVVFGVLGQLRGVGIHRGARLSPFQHLDLLVVELKGPLVGHRVANEHLPESVFSLDRAGNHLPNEVSVTAHLLSFSRGTLKRELEYNTIRTIKKQSG